MADKLLTIKYGHRYLKLSDVDEDNDIEVSIIDHISSIDESMYLNIEDIKSISEHLIYIINKIDGN